MKKIRKNISIKGLRTCLALEDEIWDSLDKICAWENVELGDLLNLIAQRAEPGSLTSSIRVFALSYFKVISQVESLGPSERPDGVFDSALDMLN